MANKEDQNDKIQIIMIKINRKEEYTSKDKSTPSNTEKKIDFEKIIQNIPCNAWVNSPNGRSLWINNNSIEFTYPNQSFSKLSPSEIISRVHPDDLENAVTEWGKHLIGDTNAKFYRYRLRNKFGQYEWFEANTRPINDENGKPLYFISCSSNIQRFIDTEDQLRKEIDQKNETISLLNRKIEKITNSHRKENQMQLANQLAGGITHDLNNLLQIIEASAEMLLRNMAQQPKSIKNIQIIIDCVHRSSQLSTQLTNFIGRSDHNPQLLDTYDVLKNLRPLLIHAAGPEIDFQAAFPPSLSPIKADRQALENALINLIINARDATNGNGSISLVAKNEKISEKNPFEAVSFCVSDNGCGMDEDIIPHVFDLYFSTKPAGKGSGIGLSMVQNFVISCNGRIEVQSTPGKGTSITIFIPRSEDSLPEQMTFLKNDQPTQARVLLIEDDEKFNDSTTQILKQLGCSIISSYHADHAMALLTSGLRPDIIIADIDLHGPKNYNDLSKWANKNHKCHLIFVTEHGEKTLPKEGVEKRIHATIEKPYAIENLAKIIQSIEKR